MEPVETFEFFNKGEARKATRQKRQAVSAFSITAEERTIKYIIKIQDLYSDYIWVKA